MDVYEIRYRNVRMLVDQLDRKIGKGGDRPGGLTLLAEMLKKTTSQIQHIASEKPIKNIGPKISREIDEVFGHQAGWLDSPQWVQLATGDEESHPVLRRETSPDYVHFPHLEGYAGMGDGDYINDYPEVVDNLRVSREWVNRKLPGVPHEAIRVITGRGDSMKGQYNDGDLIFIDIRVKSFDQDSAYCFRWAGRVQVKRLQLVRRGIVRILSKNAEYDPVDVELTEIEIGGRALAAWTLRDF